MSPDYEGSSFQAQPIRQVFRIKKSELKRKYKSRWAGNVVSEESWYAYNANYGTDEEKRFVELFSRRFKGLNQKISGYLSDS
jgi:type III restriction enzyme